MLSYNKFRYYCIEIVVRMSLVKWSNNYIYFSILIKISDMKNVEESMCAMSKRISYQRVNVDVLCVSNRSRYQFCNIKFITRLTENRNQQTHTATTLQRCKGGRCFDVNMIIVASELFILYVLTNIILY